MANHQQQQQVQCGSLGRARPGPARPARRGAQACTSPEVLEIVKMRLRVICEPTRVQIMALLDRCVWNQSGGSPAEPWRSGPPSTSRRMALASNKEPTKGWGHRSAAVMSPGSGRATVGCPKSGQSRLKRYPSYGAARVHPVFFSRLGGALPKRPPTPRTMVRPSLSCT